MEKLQIKIGSMKHLLGHDGTVIKVTAKLKCVCSIMCFDVCCNEFKGWCGSFTRTERTLTILEAFLLVALVVFLIFLILHLLACATDIPKYEHSVPPAQIPGDLEYEKEEPTLTTPNTNQSKTSEIETTTERKTIDPSVECSWTPSAKTTALIHYYEDGVTQTSKQTPIQSKDYIKNNINIPSAQTEAAIQEKVQSKPVGEDFIESDQSDGEDAETVQNKYVLALVKLKPPQDVVFGCILTIVSDYWLLTAASCIEAIEEVDSLDSFVMMEDYGTSSNGKIHSIFDLQIHPFYQGMNKSYDLAALKSESSLINGKAVELPTALDYSMITIGERFQLLGFGAYRTVDKSVMGRSLRRVYVYRLPVTQCPGSETWALRHLVPARAVPPSPCAGAALCAGPLYARGLPCNYCSGTPLLRGQLLLGLMSDNQQCGVACEPQLYVNIAAVGDWIHSVMKGE